MLDIKKNVIDKIKIYRKKKHPIGFFAWNPIEGGHSFTVNFGDNIFIKVAEQLLGQEISLVPHSYPYRKFFLGGSIIELAQDNDLIWGAGVRDGKWNKNIQNLKIFAVRGKMTADILKKNGFKVPDIYGDPAILLKKLYPHWECKNKETEIGILPHFSDLKYFGKELPSYVKLISPLQSAENAIKEITSCKKLITSSLHGIICSETFNIPVSSFRTNLLNAEPDFKYYDYYSATDREWKPYNTWKEALEGDFKSSPDFSDLAEKLKESFPVNFIHKNSFYSSKSI